jgi:hypothetical protein
MADKHHRPNIFNPKQRRETAKEILINFKIFYSLISAAEDVLADFSKYELQAKQVGNDVRIHLFFS